MDVSLRVICPTHPSRSQDPTFAPCLMHSSGGVKLVLNPHLLAAVTHLLVVCSRRTDADGQRTHGNQQRLYNLDCVRFKAWALELSGTACQLGTAQRCPEPASCVANPRVHRDTSKIQGPHTHVRSTYVNLHCLLHSTGIVLWMPGSHGFRQPPPPPFQKKKMCMCASSVPSASSTLGLILQASARRHWCTYCECQLCPQYGLRDTTHTLTHRHDGTGHRTPHTLMHNRLVSMRAAPRSSAQADQLGAQVPQLGRLGVVRHLLRHLVLERARGAAPAPVGAAAVQLGVRHHLRPRAHGRGTV